VYEVWTLLGEPRFGGILVVSDHASNRVPDDIDLGIDPALLSEHIAVDIGVREVGALLAERPGFAAFHANFSRLVCDVNRDSHAPGIVPIASDGHAIPGNDFDHAGRQARIDRFYHPYHAALAELVDSVPPALILSIHSFTPSLASRDEPRPWQVGVLYNADDRGARLALPLLEAEGLVVGDQEPYSGKLLNYTMNRHAEAEGRPYLGVEIRQDEIADAAGQATWAERLWRIANAVALQIGE
jgi:predicted N-formylglutamate amidohydrolase